MQFVLEDKDMGSTLEALFDTLSAKLFHYSCDPPVGSLSWHDAQASFTHAYQVYIRMFMEYREQRGPDNILLELLTFPDDALEQIDKLIMGSSWDDFPAHNYTHDTRCGLCKLAKTTLLITNGG